MYIGAPAKGVRVVLAEGVGVVLADLCLYMYIGAGQRGVGLVLADHCSYMYIGAGQRCGAGTGRPPNLSMTCTSKILKSSRIFDLCKLISHHGQEPKYLKQLKNDKESVGFLMVLMREPAGACPGHVQESRPTPQAFIITPAGACPGHVQKCRPTPQALITESAGSGPCCVQAGRPTLQTLNNRVGLDQDQGAYKQAGRYLRH
ncbi:uncharacterized protein EDB91DRAFT_1088749 [Suillus paluster]|uniref:uncharacterized protein n=1 Tax=Suillus paluster TaxID=48578 RepID=UPI001B87616E|nr:uncharacterized protein EDB91DRAFT_1088749 [Suillus paluster]KAG1720660.1 hypothetical protein EDB91DRAFT_1088749 [Suillus paluster]